MLPIVSPDVRDAYFGSLARAFGGFPFGDDSSPNRQVHTHRPDRMGGGGETPLRGWRWWGGGDVVVVLLAHVFCCPLSVCTVCVSTLGGLCGRARGRR